MERYFMSRRSAVGLLADARRTLAAELHEKPQREAERNQQILHELERLLLDVRVGRTREFQLVFPSRMHVIVSD